MKLTLENAIFSGFKSCTETNPENVTSKGASGELKISKKANKNKFTGNSFCFNDLGF